jgi:N-acetylglutamate synthase-like GNAT family acetyltransferase
MNTVKEPKAKAASNTSHITIRPFTLADIDFIISRQLVLYEREYGFTSETWNAYLGGGVRDFVDRFDERKDCMYILENDGVSSGCVAITHADEATAQLRFLFLEPEMRGMGAGHQLLDLAMDFCKEKEYRHVFLWTFSTLAAARHLYSSKGFLITETHENRDWGEIVLEERWDLDL